MLRAIVTKNKDGEYFFKVYNKDNELIVGDNTYSYSYVYEILSDYGLEDELTKRYPVE